MGAHRGVEKVVMVSLISRRTQLSREHYHIPVCSLWFHRRGGGRQAGLRRKSSRVCMCVGGGIKALFCLFITGHPGQGGGGWIASFILRALDSCQYPDVRDLFFALFMWLSKMHTGEAQQQQQHRQEQNQCVKLYRFVNPALWN